MGLLRIYIDDSADQKQAEVILAGAFIGWWHQWSELRREWKKCLKKHQLDYFRSTECRSLQGEFSRFRTDSVTYPKPKGREAANKIRDELDGIIHRSGVAGIAACLPMKIYNQIRATEPNAAEVFPADGYEVALQCLFSQCAEAVKTMDIGQHKVAFICDLSTSAPKITRMFGLFREQNPSYADVLTALTHQDDKTQPQLQAADLMAHLAKDRFTEWLANPAIFTNEPELKKRVKQLSVFKIAICKEKWLLDQLAHERKRRGLV